jgi:tetratricopeptide (TPR) repeat protein
VFRSRSAEARYAAALEHVAEAIDTVSKVGVARETDMHERRMAVQMLLIEFATRHIFSELHTSTAHSGSHRLAAVAGDILARLHRLPVSDGSYDHQPGSEPGRIAARLHVVEAHAAIARRHLPSAEAAIASALELDPLSGEAHWQKGVLLLRQDRIPEAISELRRARELSPDNIELPILLANLLDRSGDIEGAIAQARAATALRGGRGRAYHHLARYLGRCGRHAEALEAARRAADINPARFRPHYDAMLQKSAGADAESGPQSQETAPAPALGQST